MKISIHYLSYLTQFFLEWELVQTKVVGRVKIQILFYFIFFNSCCLWDNMQKHYRAGQATWHGTRDFACLIPKATNTLRICNIYSFYTATMVAWTHLSVILHVHCLSCFNYPNGISFIPFIHYESTFNDENCFNLWVVIALCMGCRLVSRPRNAFYIFRNKNVYCIF